MLYIYLHNKIYMPRIPEVNSINWGESFNKFLTQLLDPNTGSINIWTNETRPGGITTIAGIERGKSGWNISKGCMEVFDGNRWVELKSYISEVPTPLITSNDMTPANTEWVNMKVNKVREDFINSSLDGYISNKVKEIVRDEIIPQVNLIMETYRTLQDISSMSLPHIESSIYYSTNTKDSELADIHITFGDDVSPTGIYVSQEANVWMGYDRFLSKDLVGNTILSSIKGQQGLYFKSGTLPGVKLEPSWILHLVASPESISPNTFESSILAQTSITLSPLLYE